MGTRHLTAVYFEGEYKVAQYGQWDGYPDGQGITVLKFLRERMDLERFKTALHNTRQITEEEYKAAWEEAGADGSGWVTFDVANRLKEKHPELSRDTGAVILDIVQDHPDGIALNREVSFAADGLFCEYAWVIDLDTGMFEGYMGSFSNGRELTPEDRFYFLRDLEENDYHGVTIAGQWPIDSLPTDDEFLDHFKKVEEERYADDNGEDESEGDDE